jgi:hypothetical protein
MEEEKLYANDAALPTPTALQNPQAPSALPTALPAPLSSALSREPIVERVPERVAAFERVAVPERVPERVAVPERMAERVAVPEREEREDREDRVDHMKGETLTMQNPGRIFPHIMAQESTHFQFKTKEMERRFQQMIEQIPDLTVRFDYGREDKSDILLVSSSDPTQIVGKLHLLLVDRRDRGDPLKRYVKIHLFHMKDPQQFELVRQRIIGFFEKIGQSVRKSTTRMPMTGSQKKRVHQERRRMISLTRKRAPSMKRSSMKRGLKRSSLKRSSLKRSSLKRSSLKRSSLKRSSIKRSSMKRSSIKRSSMKPRS